MTPYRMGHQGPQRYRHRRPRYGIRYDHPDLGAAAGNRLLPGYNFSFRSGRF